MAIKTSMNIKADSTLVAGAFKEAAAKVPFSMKGMFDGLVESHGELMDTMSANFKEGAELIGKKDEKLKEAMARIQAKLDDGTIDNRQEREKMQAQLDMYREQMKNLPRGRKGKKDRSDLLFEINKYAKDKQADAADVSHVTTMINDDLYDPKQMKPEQLDFLTQIANYHAGEETAEGFKVEEDENGNTVYSFHGPSKMEMQEIDGVEQEVEVFSEGSFDKMSMKDIKKMIVPKNNKALVDANGIIADAQEYALKNPKAKFEDIYQNIVNRFENMFIDDNTSFGALVDSKLMGMKMSYKQALHSDSEMSRNILKALHDLRPGFDEAGNKDGVIDEKDFKTVKNYEIFVDALTNPQSEQFDKDLAFNLAATYFADNEAKKAFGIGETNRRGTSNNSNNNTNTNDDDGATPWKEWGADYSSQYVKTGGTDDQAKVSVTWQQKAQRRTRLDNLDIVRGEHAVYRYEPEDKNDKKPWKSDIGDFSMFEVADIEGLMKVGEGRANFEGDIAGRKSDQNLIAQGLAPFTALKTDGDDAASGELNRIFEMQMGESDYYFHPFTRDVYRGTFRPGRSDNIYTDDVMLYDKNTKRPVIDPATGEPYRFKTGDDANEDQLKILNDLMTRLGYAKTSSETNTQYED